MTYKIFENGTLINRITADEAFVETYCAEHGYIYELEERLPVNAELAGDEEIQVDSLTTEAMALAIKEGVNEV